jgi:threonine synthase
VVTSITRNAPNWVKDSTSLAICQRSLAPGNKEYPLWPPRTAGDIQLDNSIPFPLDIKFDLGKASTDLFSRVCTGGLEQWAPLLPPLAPGLSMGEGGTPLIRTTSLEDWIGTAEIYIKDESRNPTWSHKDRLNLCTISAALAAGAPGIAVASTGNHGASAAAYAARAGLPCVLITANGASSSIQAFMSAFGAAVVSVPVDARRSLLQRLVDETGYMPVSSITEYHTGHPFGPEGYKTIAYELFLQLGRVSPSAVFAPTGYAELLYGVWKGFDELNSLGLVSNVPQIVACEPIARGPLAKAIKTGQTLARVDPRPTEAVAIACTISSHRGEIAIANSQGYALTVSDSEIREAQKRVGKAGIWPEFSASAGIAGLRQAISMGKKFEGPVVAIVTSCGFKDPVADRHLVPKIEPSWPALKRTLSQIYGINL